LAAPSRSASLRRRQRSGRPVKRSASRSGGAQIIQAMSMADGQVRNDDVEPAFVWRERGKRLVDAVRQGAERSGFARTEPEHVLTEPVRMVELEAEPAHAREQALKLSKYRRIDRLGRHEREQHGHVGRDAERRAGVEAVSVRGHGWLSLGDLDDQRALRSHAGHGPDVSPARAGPPDGFRLAAPSADKPTAGKPTAGKPTAGKPTAGKPTERARWQLIFLI